MAEANETRVGIRKLKNQLSRYLRMVKKGESITITDRGRPIARIVPREASVRDRVDQLLEAGIVNWDGEHLEPIEPVVKNTSKRMVSDIISDMRE
jgi:prevent-host-death family protein